MNDSELNELADGFKASADATDAKSRIYRGMPVVCVTANRAACLRFAAAFLRAATSTIIDGDCRGEPITVDHEQVAEGKKDYALGCIIQRMETWPEPQRYIEERKRRAWRNDRTALIGCSVVGFVVMLLLASGVFFWWSIFANGK